LDVRYRDGTEERRLPNRHRFAPEPDSSLRPGELQPVHAEGRGDRTDAPEWFARRCAPPTAP
jgi:hypothetical protein